uniref:Uncharacterized protein n=1 Tax=Arundo donax TaxID=35708 RepID=A0A0A8Y9Q5_ARUDO
MADPLAKRGLPHPASFPLYDQADETIQHLLISCMVAREVWFVMLQKLGLQALAPQADTGGFSSWWCRAIKLVEKQRRKGLNTLIILVAWELWKIEMTVSSMVLLQVQVWWCR